MKIAEPNLSYPKAMEKHKLIRLEDRRENLAKVFFKQMCNEKHKLHYMLPDTKKNVYNHNLNYAYPKCKTNRFKNSFLPYSILKFHWIVLPVLKL